MTKKDINKILARNLEVAIVRKYGEVNQSALHRASKVPQTTISLLLSPERRTPLKSGELPSPTLSKIAALASALDLEAWELLHPAPEKVKHSTETNDPVSIDASEIGELISLFASISPSERQLILGMARDYRLRAVAAGQGCSTNNKF